VILKGCMSHCVSQFAAPFIVMRPKTSVVGSFRFKFINLSRLHNLIRGFHLNDPPAGSPTGALLRLFLPLSDKVHKTFPNGAETAPIQVRIIHRITHR
jgi:hypothetical protein